MTHAQTTFVDNARKIAACTLAAIASMMLSTDVVAQNDQSERFDDATVYYSSLTADQLQPEIAQRYSVERSSMNAIVNITVRGNGSNAPDLAADVSGTAQGLNSQPVNLDFRQIGAGVSLSYLADFKIARPDTVRFVITVKANGSQQSHTLKFQRDYLPQ